ncbi:PKD domain-containing protein [bacterium]|nr:PKD domain-containing protein [bacterium]
MLPFPIHPFPALRAALLGALAALCAGSPVQAQFEPNRGQWNGSFSHKLRLNKGAVFVESTGFTLMLTSFDEHDFRDHPESERSAQVVRMVLLGANPLIAQAIDSASTPTHYYLGNNPAQWKSEVYAAQKLKAADVYPGIDLWIERSENGMVFDFEVHPGADPSAIRWKYEGADSVRLREGQLHISTRVGTLYEQLPGAYQTEGHQQESVDLGYRLYADGSIGMAIGSYDRRKALVLDPVLVFSSFTGSSADNWGYTAAYDEAGNIYGAGIAFGVGYPLFTGFQSFFAGGDIDIAISKLSPDGSQLLYSTYFGGNQNEQPHSLIVDSQNRLVMLGSTGSPNFPTTQGAYDPTFNGGVGIMLENLNYPFGTDLFVAKFSASGQQLVGSTLYGGSGNDGINLGLDINYADHFRGEVILGPDESVYIASVTRSADLPAPNAHQSASGGGEDALIAKFGPDLTTLAWATYFGGSLADCANGLRLSPDGTHVYVGGGSASSNLLLSGHQTTFVGGPSDGMILRFASSSGALTASTFIGSGQRDLCFFVETDKLGGVYAFGQSFGNIPVSPGVYAFGGGGQFVQKFDAGLQTRLWSTSIGNGSLPNLSPTAFRVDDCLNIFLSGWGGITNSSNLGLMNGMPLTNNAFNPNSDGNQFYFAVLGPNAGSLVFASYFGGASREHVDGGTSRFSPEGIIYQAVCAGCANESFPTTPGVYGPSNGGPNCNLGLIKIDFETSVRAQATIDASFDSDTVCDTIFVRFVNQSQHADVFLWDFGNGQTSTQINPIARFDSLGTYTVTLIATDTVCDIVDTALVTFEHRIVRSLEVDFGFEYAECNPASPVQFIPERTDNLGFTWDFGDGSTGTGSFPQHTYSGFGSYEVTLYSLDLLCGYADTTVRTVTFEAPQDEPSLEMGEFDCALGRHVLMISGTGASVSVFWEFEDGSTAFSGPVLPIWLEAGVPTEIRATVIDSVCGVEYTLSETLTPDHHTGALFIPNTFTPNGSGPNEYYAISGDDCFSNGHLIIFDRWGGKVFETSKPFEEFWDGRRSGRPASQGVYFYLFRFLEIEKRGSVTLLR